MKNAAPWLVALLAVTAVLPVVRHQDTNLSKATQQKVEEDDFARIKKLAVALSGTVRKKQPSEDPCHPSANEWGETPSPPSWCESLRLLRDFFGLEPTPHVSRNQNLWQISRAARDSNLRLHFTVALVADPLESPQPATFDTTLDAIQKGFAQTKYQFNRFWLPWKGEAAKKNRWYREEPGIVLFQRHLDQDGELAIVFLIGESPKAGIQKRAFQEALRIASALRNQVEETEVALLGPSFSGSADSLRMALESWPREETTFAGPARPFKFRIATGSATADNLEEKFRGYEFCRTVAPDGPLRERTLQFLVDKMGWDLRSAALLAEGDTGYGQSVNAEKLGQLLLIRFPSHIADVRTAWQHDETDPKEERKVKVGDTLIPVGRPALKLNPEDQNEPVDVVPNFSSLTAPAKDLELSNVLETISRDGIRYVGILATDVNDKLFLANKIHQSSPDSILFTFENNLLFAHPEYGRVMDGTIVASSAPLFTEGARWLPRSIVFDQFRRRQQFESESQQGTFEAVRFLLGEPNQLRPQVWISAVGNGSLWPLAQLQIPELPTKYNFCGSPIRESKHLDWGRESWLAGRANLQVLLFTGGLCLLSWGLNRVGSLRGLKADGKTDMLLPINRRLTILGAAFIMLSAGVLLVVGTIPEWAPILSGEAWSTDWQWSRTLYLVPLAAIYGYLASQLILVAVSLANRTVCVLCVLGSFLVPILLIYILVSLWMPGSEIAFFQLRTRALGSGLSPLVSLALLTSAFYAWIFCEFERQRLVREQKTHWPRRALGEESLKGSVEILKKAQPWLEKMFPPIPWLGVLLASLFIPPSILLWQTIQPIAETKVYGRIFLVLLVAISALALLSFLRFVCLWRYLRRVLQRLEYVSPDWKKTFGSLSAQIEWQAMRSFVFRTPQFKMLVLSTHKIKALQYSGGPQARGVGDLLSATFQQEAQELTLAEQKSRQKLEEALKKASRQLEGYYDVPQVREFFAIRVVAYLRYFFAHMRNSLMGAIGMGLLILVAVTAYFFEPKDFVSLAIWVTLAVAVAVTFWIFLQMDRDPILSLIGGTKPGQITFDKAFFANVSLYVAVPILGMIATQFPEIGRLLGRMADQLLRVTGGG